MGRAIVSPPSLMRERTSHKLRAGQASAMSFVGALIASAVIVLSSPFMGQLQSFLRRSLSTRNYVLLFGVGVLLAVGLAILIAFLRIRERRPQRFALLLVALVFGGAYMWWTATPYAEVNAVERVHFV